MSLFPTLASWQFAAAGAFCAAIPVLIHLLNRRRYRVVAWGAMQFLQEAVQEKRRVLQLRDLLLLLVRTLSVALFGLALARPFFPFAAEESAPGQPVHAVVLIDNSLSMGYRGIAGTRLDEAKRLAAAFIEQLPSGSSISVVPLCGPRDARPAPFDTPVSAREALTRIELADRSAPLPSVLNAARGLADAVPERPARLILFTDQQRSNWSDARSWAADPNLPTLSIVDLAGEESDNTWVAGLTLTDDVADGNIPATILAEVRHSGRQARGTVRVALSVNGREVDSQPILLGTADAVREVSFQHTFREFQPDSAQPVFVPVEVSLSPDRLPEDDVRHLLVPVISTWPILFVDQYGADQENPARSRLGETRHLRQLLAPPAAPPGAAGSGARHLRIDQVDRQTLADARLVVIAGVPSPGNSVDLLRSYVEQGGQLLIGPGGEFDSAAWNASAWRDGLGILPLPLLADPVGALPQIGMKKLQPFQLDYDSFAGQPYFMLPGNTEAALRDLYAEPYFFQAVSVDTSPATISTLMQSVAGGNLRGGEGERPVSWLNWQPPEDPAAPLPPRSPGTGPLEQQQRAELARTLLQPRILARFTSPGGPPFLVERRIGRGRVLLVSSALLSNWNTLPKSNAMVVFDRILRGMLQSTFARHNYPGVERIGIPIPDALRGRRIALQRPWAEGSEEALDAGFLRPDQPGVVVEQPVARGRYRLRAGSDEPAGEGADLARSPWQYEVAVNGDPAESRLEPFERSAFDELPLSGRWRWVRAGEPAGRDEIAGRSWEAGWWLALAVLLLLLAELALAAVGHRIPLRRSASFQVVRQRGSSFG